MIFWDGAQREALMAEVGAVLKANDGGEVDEASMKARETAAHLILRASRGPTWPKPAATEDDLEALRRDAKALARRLAAIDEHARGWTNGEAARLRWAARGLSPDALVEMMARPETAPEALALMAQRPLVQSLIEDLDLLSAALPRAIGIVIKSSESFASDGRPPNWPARMVSYQVAEYFRDLTGELPGLWNASEPIGPFARALDGCFGALGITADIRRPAEWALTELRRD